MSIPFGNHSNIVRHQAASKSILVTYLRDESYTPYGVVVATKLPDNQISYGVSLCNTKKDKFNKYIGTYIATHRALNKSEVPLNTNGNDKVFRTVCEMENRASKYWKRELTHA